MRRLFAILACVLLAIGPSVGTRAHAAEAAGFAATVLAHFEGDGDQAPADKHGPVRHHHGLCHADHAGIGVDAAEPDLLADVDAAPQASCPTPLASASPGAALRPPIA
jgi:hypothetical protein